MRPDMVEAQVAPLAGTIEVTRSYGRAILAGFTAAGDSAAVGRAFYPTMKLVIARRHLPLPPVRFSNAAYIGAMTDLATGPIAVDIQSRLMLALQPTVLSLVDESALHHGHAGHDPRGESHFRLDIESAAFTGQSRVARQRLVYAALGELMTERVHALTIRATAPGER